MPPVAPDEDRLALYQPKAGMGSICTICVHRTSPDDERGECCAMSASTAGGSTPAAKLTRFVTYRETCTHFAQRRSHT
ncbi:MAG: hypothetical protein HY566_02640 [Candidatus Kerfeldbacteria bacterium]|nr:hypothetical protein [Candidatus Kerfeldbacteria bacterium]